ncbi:hypothetical protein C8R46DRAFT_1295205 [Mycena filopes]|nr:hypothetical protein C8R46DRAFT_1295205 [Mycena filopes]
MSGLAKLPIELVELITDQVSYKDLLAASRTDRRLYAVSLRRIYRHLAPSDLARTVRLFRTLSSNKQAAAYAYILVLPAVHLRDGVLLKSFDRLLRAAMENLTSLRQLHCSHPTAAFSLLSTICFPRLSEALIPFGADGAAFLRLNPTIEAVVVMLDADSDPMALYSVFAGVLLPRLRVFSGPESDPRLENQFNDVLYALRDTPIQQLHNIFGPWDPVLVTAVAEHLPNLLLVSFDGGASTFSTAALYVTTVFAILRFGNRSLRLSIFQAFYYKIDHKIGAFTKLLSLIIITNMGPVPTPDELALEFECVRRWGRLSPILRGCTLPTDTTWIRARHNVWYPLAQLTPPLPTYCPTRYAWLIERVLSAPPSLGLDDYLSAFEALWRPDELAALRVAVEEGREIDQWL